MVETSQKHNDRSVKSKLIKDIKYFIVGVIAMSIGIFHYLWIIKKWLLNPDISTNKLVVYFSLFLITQIFIWYLYLFQYGPILYKEELAKQKIEDERLKREHDEIMKREHNEIMKRKRQ